eukprot:6176135-Pleurochrysis_carterae.AAC.2
MELSGQEKSSSLITRPAENLHRLLQWLAPIESDGGGSPLPEPRLHRCRLGFGLRPSDRSLEKAVRVQTACRITHPEIFLVCAPRAIYFSCDKQCKSAIQRLARARNLKSCDAVWSEPSKPSLPLPFHSRLTGRPVSQDNGRLGYIAILGSLEFTRVMGSYL